VGWRSGRSWVTVFDDEARVGEGGDGGDVVSSWLLCWVGGGESSSSGLAMRSPPSVCDRLRSPFIVAATGTGQQHWR
jgi:hypothetical protein